MNDRPRRHFRVLPFALLGATVCLALVLRDGQGRPPRRSLSPEPTAPNGHATDAPADGFSEARREALAEILLAAASGRSEYSAAEITGDARSSGFTEAEASCAIGSLAGSGRWVRVREGVFAPRREGTE